MRTHREITCHRLPPAHWHPARVPGAAAGRPPNALSAGERGELLAILDSPRFQDKAPRQVWALLIDEGTYLASVSTMYRLLREAGQVRERRAQAANPARTKPELIADAPNEVWSWDITKLAGPQRGVYYHLFVTYRYLLPLRRAFRGARHRARRAGERLHDRGGPP